MAQANAGVRLPIFCRRYDMIPRSTQREACEIGLMTDVGITLPNGVRGDSVDLAELAMLAMRCGR
jgi:hypothetical protein